MTHANMEELQGCSSFNMPRIHQSSASEIDDDSFTMPQQLPKLSVSEQLANAKSASNLSSSNNNA